MVFEILRYEKYDVKVDFWFVGVVLFEMFVGCLFFWVNNYVELLWCIEKSNDNIVFFDEKERDFKLLDEILIFVLLDIKVFICVLLKCKLNDWMGFDDFFNCGVWDGYMVESMEEESLSLDVLMDSFVGFGESDWIR